jgi:hypothetical protein
MSVHVDKETLVIAQRTIDNVICDLKMTLDRLMFDEGIDLLELDLEKTIIHLSVQTKQLPTLLPDLTGR